jgi:hypothetical protein
VKLSTKALSAALGLLILAGALQLVTRGPDQTTQQVTNPRRIDRAIRDDGRRQVIIQAWWSPPSLSCNATWRIGELAQGSTVAAGANARLPFERRGWVKQGEVVYFGWSFTPGPFAYIRWRIWLSGQVVKSGESKSLTMAITEVPWG